MNETFAKILQITLVFWLVLTLFSTLLASRIATYLVNDDATSSVHSNLEYENIGLLSGFEILYDVMTFQVMENVPIWISAVLDGIFILTGISILMLIFNR